jgi:ACR3 family arsenite efflux pump ArsB
MIILIGGLVTTATAVLIGVLISVTGLLLMVGVATAVFRWRRRP